MIKNPGVREYILRDLVTYTEYTLALQVINPEGYGPVATVIVMTVVQLGESNLYTIYYSIGHMLIRHQTRL